MTSDITVSSVLNQTQKTSNAAATIAGDFDDFLKLLTTQLQYQDPLSPMDSNQFTQQLVSFAGVEQQLNTNQKLDSLVQLQLSNIFGSALGYVGMDVSYLSNEAHFDGTNPVGITYAIPKSANYAQISIIDADGETVYTAPAEKTAGKHEFSWNGKNTFGDVMPEGTYTVRIDALDTDDKSMTVTTVVKGRVRGVETQDGIIHLLIGERAVPLSNILNAAVPDKAETDAET